MLNQTVILTKNPKPGDHIEIIIDSLTAEGLGQATFQFQLQPEIELRKCVVFVRYGIPGDRLRVRIQTSRRKRISAVIETILEPSPMRITPRCMHFGQRVSSQLEQTSKKGCGGCTLQSISYRHQLALKEKTVKKLMADENIDPGKVYPVIGQEDPWFYRNKMEFSFGDDHHRDFALGLHPTGMRHDILSLEECFLESDFASKLVKSARKWSESQGFQPYLTGQKTGFLQSLIIREGKRSGERLIELVTTDDESTELAGVTVTAQHAAQHFCEFLLAYAAEQNEVLSSLYWTQFRNVAGERSGYTEHLMHGLPVLHEEMHLPGNVQLRFEIHPRAFFQPNTLQAEMLYATVLDRTGLVQSKETNGDRSATILDLYCGTGTIGMCLAPFAHKVIGIELQADAVENARRNATLNGITNIEFFVGDVGKVLASPEFSEALSGNPNILKTPDIIIIDPPRSGLMANALAHLEMLNAPRIVYVSCNPKSLARDLRLLRDLGYSFDHIQPIDMFPQTYHIENIVVLNRA